MGIYYTGLSNWDMAFLLLLWTALLSVKMKLFMKKLILIIFTLLITYFSYGQVIMNIDSVDISRPTESLAKEQ